VTKCFHVNDGANFLNFARDGPVWFSIGNELYLNTLLWHILSLTSEPLED